MSGYAVALLVVTLGLDAMARTSQRPSTSWARARSGRFHRRVAALLMTVSAGFLVSAAVLQPTEGLVLLPFSLAWAGVAWALSAPVRRAVIR